MTKKLKTFTLIGLCAFICIFALLIGYFLIQSEYQNFKTHLDSFEQKLINDEKQFLQRMVNNIAQDITFEIRSSKQEKKALLKEQLLIGYNIATHIATSLGNQKSKQKNLQHILSTVFNSSYDFFLLDRNGTLLFSNKNKKDIGVSLIHSSDINGKKFIQEMTQETREIKYVEYIWYKTGKEQISTKMNFVKYFAPLDIFIGVGDFIDSFDELVRTRISHKLSSTNYKQDASVALHFIWGLNFNASHEVDFLFRKNLGHIEEYAQTMKDFLIQTNYKGNDFGHWELEDEIFYATYLSTVRLFVSVGVKLANIKALTFVEKQASTQRLQNKIIILIIFIAMITGLFFYIAYFFSNQLESVFEDYKQKVIENEEKYRLLFNHSNDAFIISSIKDSSAFIVSANAMTTKVSGYALSELLGKDFFSLFKDLQANIVGEEYFGVVHLYNKQKQLRFIELTCVSYVKTNQTLLFASLRDVTERTQLRRDKQEQEQLLIQRSKLSSMGEMIGNIAHQWRQPLNQISGLFLDIELAHSYQELDDKYLYSRVNEANNILEYMSKTIDDFRNFFNPTSKKAKFSLVKSVSQVLQIIHSSLQKQNINITVDISEEIYLMGYQNEYAQAILNVISNAKDILIKNKIKNPSINIYATKIQNSFSLVIQDNAGGVEPALMQKIFEPYFTTKYKYGTGIGLYICKIIIEERMNGKINIKNVQQDNNLGACFSIFVPNDRNVDS